jgi:hypothetical protein
MTMAVISVHSEAIKGRHGGDFSGAQSRHKSFKIIPLIQEPARGNRVARFR